MSKFALLYIIQQFFPTHFAPKGEAGRGGGKGAAHLIASLDDAAQAFFICDFVFDNFCLPRWLYKLAPETQISNYQGVTARDDEAQRTIRTPILLSAFSGSTIRDRSFSNCSPK